jgi:hypothetical protein
VTAGRHGEDDDHDRGHRAILFMMFTIFLLPFVMVAMILILFIVTAPRHAPPRRCPSVPVVRN